MRDGFIKVAAGTPQIRVADCRYNAEQIFTLMREADKQGVRVLALPELCLYDTPNRGGLQRPPRGFTPACGRSRP